MAKNNYLFGILSAAAVFICGYAGSDNIVVSCRLPVVSKRLVQKEIDSPNGKQKDESPKPIAQGPMQKGYQEGALLGAKSVFLTTDNRQLVTCLRFRQLSIKKIYDSQIGVRERGINAGPHVEEYLHYVNLGRGQPWCAAFICWVFGQAEIENPRSAWSPDLFKGSKVIWDRAESRKQKAQSREKYQVMGSSYQDGILLGSMSVHPTTNSRQPTTADIFGIFFPEKNRIAHAGFVDQWGETWLITVEGNTNMEGSREGDGVYRKRRLVRSVYKVARYIW
ncbi:MAG: hypothetical protein K9G42_00985 [Pedobacter sp.]|nr:hypothetical protein [Pedobacter sp.]